MAINRPTRDTTRAPKRQHRKVCSFCVEKVKYIDYKEISRLRRFISDRGKILPRRVTGTRAMNRPLIDHRGPECAASLAEVTAGAKRVFQTKADLLLLTSSGTGGLESAVANLVSPGDEVVVALCGNFGERFAALAAAYGAEVA